MPAMPIFEADLYPHVENFLHIEFAPRLKPSSGRNLTIAAITATRGPASSGTWSRPDLAMVNVWRHKYHPVQTLDVYGFEVKRDGGLDLTSVHETLAHTRLVHYAYLVWHYRSGDFSAPAFNVIRENCRAYGLGLITFHELGNPLDFNVHLNASRANPKAADVDDFIETRFPDDHKARLLAWIEERH